MGRFLTIFIFFISLIYLCFGIKWILDGDLFYGIVNTFFGIFNTYNFWKYIFKSNL